MKKLLIYNWIPFDEKLNKGGGVTVYTRNLIKGLLDSKQYEVYFLSSGRAYNPAKPKVYIEQTENIYGAKCKSFQIVNSPVLSSARLAFCYLKDYIYDRKLLKVICAFIDEMRGFDIIHFQNLEGLSLEVLGIKKNYPNTKVIFSMHNYFPICPQVMLWRRDKRKCDVPNCGEVCLECIPTDVYKWKVIFNQSVTYYLEKKGKENPIPFVKWMQCQLDSYCSRHHAAREKSLLRKREELGRVYAEFEKKNVEYLNLYIDAVLVVSKRVGEIARKRGICQEKIYVSYIGTDVAKSQLGVMAYPYTGEQFNICYLGYMRTMKGFYFLLDALEQMDSVMAQKVGVRFATKITDVEAKRRIEELADKFGEVKLYDGYTHEELPEILRGVQLGIVPVLWEDNLPQVAMELKANGIPVLASDLGGAKELSQLSNFVFEAGNVDAFLERIADFVDMRIALESYWINNEKLVTMEEHIEELSRFYI